MKIVYTENNWWRFISSLSDEKEEELINFITKTKPNERKEFFESDNKIDDVTQSTQSTTSTPSPAKTKKLRFKGGYKFNKTAKSSVRRTYSHATPQNVKLYHNTYTPHTSRNKRTKRYYHNRDIKSSISQNDLMTTHY